MNEFEVCRGLDRDDGTMFRREVMGLIKGFLFVLCSSWVAAEEPVPAMPKKFDHESKAVVIEGVPVSIGLASAHELLAEYRIWATVEPKGKPKVPKYLAYDTGGTVTPYVSKLKDGSIILWNGATGELKVKPATGEIVAVKEGEVEREELNKTLIGRFYWDPGQDGVYRYFPEAEFKKVFGKE